MSVCVFLLFFLCVSNIDGASRTVTNEDIRDAILSIVSVIRSTEDKLERHELRERTLGDQIKRVLWIIEKRQRLFDPVKGTIGRLDQRLATVETILMQKDERERIQVQRVFDMVEQIHRSLPLLFETLKNDITSSFSSGEEEHQDAPNNVEIEKLQKQIANKIDDTSSTVKSIEGQLSQIREENKNNFSSTHKFMEQYDNKLNEYNKQIDIIPSRCKQVTDLQTNVILKALEIQDANMKKLQAEMNSANATIRDLQEKILKIHGNIESGQKDVKENLKELVKDNRQNYQNYDSKLSAYKEKIDAIPTIYKNGTEAQTMELLKALEAQTKQVKKLEKHIENKTLSTNDALQIMQTNLEKIHENTQKHGDISESIKKNITIHNELLQKYNAKLDDYHAEYRELSDMQNIRQILDNHTTNSWELQKGVNNQLSDIRSENAKILETTKDLTKLLNNKTTECNNSAALEEIKNVTTSVQSGLEDLKKKSDNTKLIDSMKMLEELTDSLNTNIALSFGKLMDEMNNLEKLEEIVRQTGDGVVDTKRRVEYGVHQISTEVSNLIKAQTKELSTALNTRFNNLETSLLDEDEGILANLTTKTAQEVDQVWKQIGMMHQQLTSTNELISGLVSRADRFSNGTTTTMDTMRGKIGIITSRVIEVGNNLNTLLGRISLISQEFNIIKKELGNTLNEMKRQTVENRMRPLPTPTGSSGPYPVNRI